MIKFEVNPGRPRFKSEYVFRLRLDQISRYAKHNRCSVTITDKHLSFQLLKENQELKQQLKHMEERVKELELEVEELKRSADEEDEKEDEEVEEEEQQERSRSRMSLDSQSICSEEGMFSSLCRNVNSLGEAEFWNRRD